MSGCYDVPGYDRAQAEYDRAEPPTGDVKSLDEMDCDDLKPYCPWDGPAVTGGPNGPISCEGRFCREAYESYLEESEEA